MAYNDRKIIEVLREELDQVEEKYNGYKEDLYKVLKNILNLERQHALSRRNIVKDISSEINKVGMKLYNQKNQ